MTIVAMTVQQTLRTGIKPTYAAANAGGNSFANDGRVRLVVVNGGVGSVTVTIDVVGTLDGLAVSDIAQAVPAGETWEFGPFAPGIFNQPDGTVNVSYSGVTSVTVAAIRQ